MPTVISHAAVPLAIGLGLGSNLVPRRLLLAGVAASMVPDMDVIGLKLGIAYDHDMGHRGITHSMLFALISGLAAYYLAPWLKSPPRRAALFVFMAGWSHGILDMFTNGGLGIAFFWPFSHERYFLPWRFIEVSPLTMEKVFSARGLQVMYSELRWVWLPCISIGLALAAARYWAKRFRQVEMNRT
jgi:inner membrane protein